MSLGISDYALSLASYGTLTGQLQNIGQTWNSTGMTLMGNYDPNYQITTFATPAPEKPLEWLDRRVKEVCVSL